MELPLPNPDEISSISYILKTHSTSKKGIPSTRFIFEHGFYFFEKIVVKLVR